MKGDHLTSTSALDTRDTIHSNFWSSLVWTKSGSKNNFSGTRTQNIQDAKFDLMPLKPRMRQISSVLALLALVFKKPGLFPAVRQSLTSQEKKEQRCYLRYSISLYSQFPNWLIHFQELNSLLGTKFLQKGAGIFRRQHYLDKCRHLTMCLHLMEQNCDLIFVMAFLVK